MHRHTEHAFACYRVRPHSAAACVVLDLRARHEESAGSTERLANGWSRINLKLHSVCQDAAAVLL